MFRSLRKAYQALEDIDSVRMQMPYDKLSDYLKGVYDIVSMMTLSNPINEIRDKILEQFNTEYKIFQNEERKLNPQPPNNVDVFVSDEEFLKIAECISVNENDTILLGMEDFTTYDITLPTILGNGTYKPLYDLIQKGIVSSVRFIKRDNN